ncbi:MAG TPA: serine/threonine-protein kinase [Polyangiales bacterium]
MPNVIAISNLSSRPKPGAQYVPGALLADKYRLERPLAIGGMGTVWLARNEQLDLPVALKLILPEIQDQETAARLLLEARATARLQHPSIVRVLDFGASAEGDPFIVMELLEGCSFAVVLAEQACNPVLCVQTLLPVVDALCHAHAHGIVHRDLKPDNIFLVPEEHGMRPKLLDFGIAKVAEHATAGIVTGRHLVFGSPAYMSPEQACGSSDVDHRADIWSVCVVLYEAVSGRAPFVGSNAHAVMNAVIESDVAPLVDSETERSLWPILSRGLAKQPANRYQSMSELGNALASWLSAHGVNDDVCGEPLLRSWQLAVTPFDEAITQAITQAIPEHRMPAPAQRDMDDSDTPKVPKQFARLRASWLARAALTLGVGFVLSAFGSTLTDLGPERSASAGPQIVFTAPQPAPAARVATNARQPIAPPPQAPPELVATRELAQSSLPVEANEAKPAGTTHTTPEPRSQRAQSRLAEARLGLKDPYR